MSNIAGGTRTASRVDGIDSGHRDLNNVADGTVRSVVGRKQRTAARGNPTVVDLQSRGSQRPAERIPVGHAVGAPHRAPHPTTKQAVTTRLRRIGGQVSGLQRMVEDNRYCVDILTQINAVRATLHKVGAVILRDHVSYCVAHAFASGDRAT
jgi:DNA-binding FrmR family transcriptional regulator